MRPPDDLIELGRILGAHGVQGWIKIQPFSVDSDVLAKVKTWWIAASDVLATSETSAPKHRSPNSSNKTLAPGHPDLSACKPAKVVWAKSHGASFLACIDGLSDRDAAQSLKGHTIYVARSLFPRLAEDEYYWVDLIGSRVFTDASGQMSLLGVVESMQDNPAHPIMVVRQQTLSSDGSWSDRLDARGRALHSLIPFVAAHVHRVDLAQSVIETNWPSDF